MITNTLENSTPDTVDLNAVDLDNPATRGWYLQQALANVPPVDIDVTSEEEAKKHVARLRGSLRDLMALGLYLFPVARGGKTPAVTAPRGVNDATNDIKTFMQMYRRGMNVGVNLGLSGLVVIDADTHDEVEALSQLWQTIAGKLPEPTVTTPGSKGQAHAGGGHWWVVADKELTAKGLEFDTPHEPGEPKAVFKTGNHYVLLPGCKRDDVADKSKPFYECVGNVSADTGAGDNHSPMAVWVNYQLRTRIEDEAARVKAKQDKDAAKERARIAREEAGVYDDDEDDFKDEVDDWTNATPWHEILSPAGWIDTGVTDSCGCETWTAPGAHSSPKSATAHVCDTTRLHVWTDNPGVELEEAIKEKGRRSLSKLEVYAALYNEGDIGEALRENDIHTSGEPTGMPLPGAQVLSEDFKDYTAVLPTHTHEDVDEAGEAKAVEQTATGAPGKTSLQEKKEARTQAEADYIAAMSPAEAEVYAGLNKVEREEYKRLAAMPPAEVEVYAGLSQAVREEYKKLAARKEAEEAYKRISALEEDNDDPVPEWTAEELDAIEFPTQKFLIEDVLPRGAVAMIHAPAKTGKSRLTHYMIECLVKGKKFAGEYEAHTPDGAVMLWDMELLPEYLQERLHPYALGKSVKVRGYRGHKSALNIENKHKRDKLVKDLKESNVKVLVVDNLSVIIEASRLDENVDGGKVILELQTMAVEAGVETVLIVDHRSYKGGGEVGSGPRGDSKKRDYIDVELALEMTDGDPFNPQPTDRYQLSVGGRINPHKIPLRMDGPRYLVDTAENPALMKKHAAMSNLPLVVKLSENIHNDLVRNNYGEDKAKEPAIKKKAYGDPKTWPGKSKLEEALKDNGAAGGRDKRRDVITELAALGYLEDMNPTRSSSAYRPTAKAYDEVTRAQATFAAPGR